MTSVVSFYILEEANGFIDDGNYCLFSIYHKSMLTSLTSSGTVSMVFSTGKIK
jgi:hypothetical protein